MPAIAWMPGKIKPDVRNHDILGDLDLMATFAALAGATLPTKDRDGKPIIFDSYDMSPVLFGTGKSDRDAWFYFTENELTPGACGSATTRRCSTCAVTINQAVREKMKTYIDYPPRKLQSEGYAGPITLTQYERLKSVRDDLAKQGFEIPLPTGN